MMLSGHLLVATGGYFIFKAYPFVEALKPSMIMLIELGLVWLGCMLPDVDHPDSTLGKKLKLISIPISMVFGHRGILHSLIACIGLMLISYHYNWLLMNYVILGYVLHLLGDFLTPSGIPLFYPSKRRYRFMIVAKTNSIGETILAGSILIAGIYSAFWIT